MVVIIAIIAVASIIALEEYYFTTRPSITQENYQPEFLANRQQLAGWLARRYNSTYGLLQGASFGGCGYQPNAFDLMPDNFLAAKSLEPYNATLGNVLGNSTNNYLGKAGYQHNYRLEVLFGNQIPYPPQSSQVVSVQGNAPDQASCSKTSLWVFAEFPNSTSAGTSYLNMGVLVSAVLEKYREGDLASAQSIFNIGVGWWHSDSAYNGGFLSPQAQNTNHFFTKDICYFLFAQRATRFPVSAKLLNQSETRLWSTQNSSGGLPVYFDYSGTVPSGARSNILTNSICLLAYDSRIQSEWWPSTQHSGFSMIEVPLFLSLFLCWELFRCSKKSRVGKKIATRQQDLTTKKSEEES